MSTSCLHGYILYYSVSFIVITHACPFFAIACRDKDIIDALHRVQDVLPMQRQLEPHQTLADVEKLLMDTRKQFGRPSICVDFLVCHRLCKTIIF